MHTTLDGAAGETCLTRHTLRVHVHIACPPCSRLRSARLTHKQQEREGGAPPSRHPAAGADVRLADERVGEAERVVLAGRTRGDRLPQRREVTIGGQQTALGGQA